MNIRDNLAKSCVLATVIFWTVIATESIEPDAIPFVFLSMIPIFFSVTIVIVISICPFFWAAEGANLSKAIVFKTSFPYYAIIVFGLSFLGIIVSDFDTYMIAFSSSFFITTSQSWVWFAKDTVK